MPDRLLQLPAKDYETIVAALAQVDHGFHHGFERGLIEAAKRNVQLALKALGQKTAAEEQAAEDGEDEE